MLLRHVKTAAATIHRGAVLELLPRHQLHSASPRYRRGLNYRLLYLCVPLEFVGVPAGLSLRARHVPRIFRSACPADAQEWTRWSNLDYFAKLLSSATVAEPI